MTEGNAGTVDATFTVTPRAASGQTVTVDYATADGTATRRRDYTRRQRRRSPSPPGQTTQDGHRPGRTATRSTRSNETFFVNLSSAVNATIADGQGVGTITDDDAPPTLSIDDVDASPRATPGTRRRDLHRHA